MNPSTTSDQFVVPAGVAGFGANKSPFLTGGLPGSARYETGANYNAAAQQVSRKQARGENTLAAIVFEFDNLLYDSTSWIRWLWQLLNRMGLDRDFSSFREIWWKNHLCKVHCGALEFPAAQREFLTALGFGIGQIDEVEAASAAQRREQGISVRPLPGVANTLSQLSAAGMRLGVLANSELTHDELHQRLEKLGLRDRFSFALSSRSLKCAKPEVACYQAALAELQLPPHEVGYVDAASDDLIAAAALGLRTFALNSGGKCAAEHSLKRFDDLVEICTKSLAPAAVV